MILTRRTLAGSAVLGLLATLTACADDDAPSTVAAAPTAAGPWTWTDDRGDVVELDAVPQRLVVSQWLLPAFWALGIRPVGVLTFMPWADIDGYTEAGIAESDVTVLSTTYGEVDLEAMVGLAPDLVVLDAYEGQQTLWGFLDLATQRKAAAIAPLVAVSGDTDAITGTERRRELAASLGADLSSAEAVAAKEQFDTASQAIADVVAAQPGLTVGFVGPFADGLFVAPVADYADLGHLASLGLTIWAPDPAPAEDILSWENAAGVDADVLFIDDRDDIAQAAGDSAVFAGLPAVASGQAAARWRFALPYEYAAFARSFDALRPTLEAARPL